MAVEDKYVDADLEAGKKASGLFSYGAETTVVSAIVAVAAADDDNSVYRIFSGVPSSYVPIMISINNTLITAGTDYDVGLYKGNSGVVVEVDILADGLDLSTAVAGDVVNNVGLTDVALADRQKTLGELSGQSDIDANYDIAITANTVGSAAGTILVTAVFAYK